MPDQAYDAPTADKVLEFLEDYALTTYQSRCSNYQTIQGILEKENHVDNEAIKRLLAICIHDLKEDMKYAVNTLNIITVILKKFEAGEYDCLPELTISALAILNIIKTTALISKVQTLQILCFDTFLLFPDETYCELGSVHCSEVMEVFNMYFHQAIPIGIRLMPFNILFKMLKTLPPDKRLTFVTEGLSTWFTKVIPVCISAAGAGGAAAAGAETALDALELLAAELQRVDYSQHPHWQTVVENILFPQKYPAVMKTLLENGNENWCRLWKVFVKLLKHQITLNRNKHGSPINSMLPVVEVAFKMDYHNRCRAFACWNVLIDNFSTETNESFVTKRIKLLIIPLKSNNAKLEQTALAKFETWWHLIRKFQHRLDKHFDIVFIPFLHFCFGNPKHGEDKNILVPGLAFPTTTKKCVQAFVEITGDLERDGCLPKKLPKLAHKILEPKLFLDFLTDWIYSLKVFTKLLSSEKCVYEEKDQYLKCVWSSFLSTAAEMTEDNRHVAYGELLALMTQLSKECHEEKGTQETVFNIITSYMTENKTVWTALMRDTENTQTSQLYKTLRLMISPNLQNLCAGWEQEATVKKLQPLSGLLMKESQAPKAVVEWFLAEARAGATPLWAAVLPSAVSAAAGCDVTADHLHNMLLWPLRHMDGIKDTQYLASVWNTLYDKLRERLNDSCIENDILKLLVSSADKSPNHFALYALLKLIKKRLSSDNSIEWKTEAELLVSFLSKIKTHQQLESAFPVVIETLEMMIKKIGEGKNSTLAEYILTAVNTTLKLLLASAKSSGPKDEHSKNIKKLLTPLNEQFKTDLCIKYKFLLVEQLIACASVFDNFQSIKDTVCSILKSFLKKSKATEVPFYSVVNEAIITIEKVNQKPNAKDIKLFTSPKVIKKSKKREASIVNTVVENGEEFVVVKSNWKFNPRKLTENQKEKLQRKREDIPALYQDLSQSQDEFKMTTWKTDSQDTSTSNSASKSNSIKTSDVSSVLKKMASTDVVPQIMENIFPEKKSEAVESKSVKEVNENTTTTTPKAKKVPTAPTPKQVKSPRVALKDRIFQNVKNLIEKSNLNQDATPKDINKTVSDPGPQTPVGKVVSEVTATYSAPPKICLERPARVKRKPKKYEFDFAELNKKKRRNSLTIDRDSDQVEKSSSESHDEDVMVSNEPVVIEDNETDKNQEAAINDEVKAVEVKTVESAVELDVASIKSTNIEKHEPAEKEKVDKMDKECIVVPPVQTDETIETPKTAAIPDSQTIGEKEIDPPQQSTLNKTVELDKAKTSNKKLTKKSRIVKELAIDTVEGHPFLNVEEKRSTRKNNTTPISTRRKALCEKLNKSSTKTEVKTPKRLKATEVKKDEEVFVKKLSAVTKGTPENFSTTSSCLDDIINTDIPMSEDFIESSQDSTLTTISAKSIKSVSKNSPKVVVEKMNSQGVKNKRVTETQNMLSQQIDEPTDATINAVSDIEFSRNKVVEDVINLTPEFDTEPVEDKPLSSSQDVIIINDEPEMILINTENSKVDNDLNSEALEIANADTEPIEADMTLKILNRPESMEITKETQDETVDKTSETANEMTVTFQSTVSESDDLNDTSNGLSSPYKDDEQRNQDFLNNTLEISPIKTMSPVPAENNSPAKNEFVVIKLSSPVQSNGEPFEKLGSPEIFTEDKVSPDKRDQSPPREEMSVNSGNSPSCSLSLKKNRPVRGGGRAAQMLGLCVPDNLIVNSERVPDNDEPKKTPPVTPARRNLKILYNCADADNSDDSEESPESFLKFKRALPTAECSPSGPILKRKLADIADEATVSPASKRKRVSFHDPPVSTTVSVHKYLSASGERGSPARPARPARPAPRRAAAIKSPKKLETIFKLDTALTKTVESFVDLTYNSEDMSSLDPTLTVEVVKNDELNDTDPICLPLVNCSDPIKNIAAELSSPAMKDLLVKELEGSIETIGDLAKLTELEVNRLCIKAPKVQTAKRALSDYAEKMLVDSQDFGPIEQTVEAQIHVTQEPEPEKIIETIESKDSDMQTDEILLSNMEAQTIQLEVGSNSTQTDAASVASCAMQTEPVNIRDELKSMISENSPYLAEILADELDEESKEKIAQSLTWKPLARLLNKQNLCVSEVHNILDSLLEKTKLSTVAPKSYILKKYIADTFSEKDIILLCSQLLLQVHDNKPT